MPMCILYKAFSMPFVIYNRLDDCSIVCFMNFLVSMNV